MNTGIKLDKGFFSRYIYCVEMLKAALYDEVDAYHPLLQTLDDGVERMMQIDVYREKIESMVLDDDYYEDEYE